MTGFRVPSATYRGEIEVAHSRFLVTAALAKTVEDAKAALRAVRAEMPDATHHVYAYRIGHGNSVIEGMSDDGEPSHTAAPPILAVLRGSNMGDILVVVTRYYGGTKLGTGGLVRAYSDAARLALNNIKTEYKVARVRLSLHIPYSFYKPIQLLFAAYQVEVADEVFTEAVALTIVLPQAQADAFTHACAERSDGRVIATPAPIPLLS